MIRDEMLAQAAEKAAAILNESLPEPSDCGHVFSARFERRMKPLLRRSSHPVMYRALRNVASILLVMLIGFGSVLVVNADARELVFGWAKRQERNFYEYFFVGEQDNSKSHNYLLGWIPDGCEYVTTIDTAGGKIYIYTDNADTLIQFSYISDPDNGSLFVNTVDYDKESININGCPGEFYRSPNEEETSGIIWTNEENVLFSITGNFDKETFIKMAESVLKK